MAKASRASVHTESTFKCMVIMSFDILFIIWWPVDRGQKDRIITIWLYVSVNECIYNPYHHMAIDSKWLLTDCFNSYYSIWDIHICFQLVPLLGRLDETPLRWQYATLLQKLKTRWCRFIFFNFLFFCLLLHTGVWLERRIVSVDRPGSIFITFLAWLGKKINWPFVKWLNNFLFAVVE